MDKTLPEGFSVPSWESVNPAFHWVVIDDFVVTNRHRVVEPFASVGRVDRGATERRSTERGWRSPSEQRCTVRAD